MSLLSSLSPVSLGCFSLLKNLCYRALLELNYSGGVQGGANPNAEDAGGQKPIHAAAAEQHREVVELLLPLTAPDNDSSADWTVDGVIQEAQQSIADDQPLQQPQHQVHSVVITVSGFSTLHTHHCCVCRAREITFSLHAGQC